MYKRDSFQTITVVVLVVGCLVMTALLTFPNLFAKKENNLNNKNVSKEIIEDDTFKEDEINIEGQYVPVKSGVIGEQVHPKLNDTFLKNTIHLFNTDFSGNYFGYYFKQDKILVKDMDKEVILNLALQGFANKISSLGNPNEICVDKKEIKDYYKNIFDKDIIVSDINKTIYNETGDFNFKNEKYCGELLTGKDTVGYNIYQRIVGYNKGSFYLEIFTKYTFCQVVYNETTKEPDCVFRKTMDIDKTDNILGRAKFSFTPSQEMFDKANTYKYTFKMKDDNLYFYSVEKV